MRLLPQKHRINVEKWRTLYTDGAPLDSAEDRIILYHIEHIWKRKHGSVKQRTWKRG